MNVIFRYDLRMDVIFDRIVLGRKSECVPAHGIQYVVAFHSSLTRNDIQRRIRAGMSNVQPLS